MIDLLYVAHNRAQFTAASFDALVANTDWQHVRKLYVADDGSTDSTRELLERELIRVPLDLPHSVRVIDGPVGGPVAAMNRYLDSFDDADIIGFAKIDNDIIVPPGWLPDLVGLARANPHIDAIGLPAQEGPAAPAPLPGRGLREASFIGGVGLIRHRAFEHFRPVPKCVRSGWTEFQLKHPTMRAAWPDPPLPCFELDRLPFEPWRTLAAEYCARGWSRPWEPYPGDGGHMWAWWQPTQVAA